MTPIDFIPECAASISTLDIEAVRTVFPGSPKSFLSEIVLGIQEHHNVIFPAIKVFFRAYAARIARTDRQKCFIFAYLLLFQLERMGMSDFERHMKATNASLAMRSLLTFFTDDAMLNEKLPEAWREYYDADSIQRLTTPLREACSALKELCARISDSSGRQSSLYKLSKELPGSLPKLQKAQTHAKARHRILSNQDELVSSESSNVHFKATPMPRCPASCPEVKLTTAVILREDAMYQRNQAKAAALLQAYETELRDSMPFYQWRAQMQQQDDAAQASVTAARRLEMAQAKHFAKEAAISVQHDNKRIVESMKMIAENLELERTRQNSQTLCQNRSQMTQIKHVRECAPRNAQVRLRRDKRSQAAELNALLEEERVRKELQTAAEHSKREETLREIRALHTSRGPHIASFNPSETAQLGLLEEMSQSELEARLCAQKAEIAMKEREKRQQIAQAKSEKTDKLQAKMANLMRFREARSTQSRRQRMISQQNQVHLQHEYALAAERAEAEALKAVNERTATWDTKAVECKRYAKVADKKRNFRKKK